MEGDAFRVMGGRFMALTGAGVTHSDIAEASLELPLSMYNVRLHVLNSGDLFSLANRSSEEPQ